MRTTTIGDDAWLTTGEVAERLGVQSATVYAYVSRGLLTSERVGRRSRFRLSEVDTLQARLDPGHGRSLSVAKRVFRLEDGQPFYREVPALELADTATFEQVVDLLWTGTLDAGQKWPRPDASNLRIARQTLAALPTDTIISDRLKVAVATLEALGHEGSSFYAPDVAASGRRLLLSVVHTLPRIDGGAGVASEASEPLGLAASLWPRLTAEPVDAERIALLDAALVLSAEHGMAPSTTVARTAASLGATIHGVVASGLGAGTGDVMGSSALIVEDVLRRLHRSPHAIRGIAEQARIQGRVAGFGHVAYPEGDVRSRYLLSRLAQITGDEPRFAEAISLARVMQERGLPPPTLYFALATVAHCFQMSHGSAEAMFFIGRSAGWIAHALDEYGRK